MLNAQQRAVIAAAQKDGLHPMEVSAELLCHDLMGCLLEQLRKRQVAFPKLSEKEQDAAISEMQAEVKKAAYTAARVITAQGKEAVSAKLKSLKIDGKLTATMLIEGDEPNRHILTDKAHDKSDILIVLYPNSYTEGLSAHQAEKDQKDLPLSEDDDKPKTTRKQSDKPKAGGDVAKEIVLAPKLIDQAREFVKGQQNTSLAGLQNQFKIGADKARAVFAKLVESGDVTVAEGVDKWDLVRESASSESESLEEQEADDAPANDVLSVALYEQIKASVIKRNAVSVGVICIDNDVSEDLALAAIEQMEDEGVVTEEDELGGRGVVEQA